MPASNGRIWRCAFSTACSTLKAVCPVAGLMKLKWTRYINQQERTNSPKKLKIPYIFYCPLLFQIVADSIQTPFLARASDVSMECWDQRQCFSASKSLLKGACSDLAVWSRHKRTIEHDAQMPVERNTNLALQIIDCYWRHCKTEKVMRCWKRSFFTYWAPHATSRASFADIGFSVCWNRMQRRWPHPL